MTKQSNQQEDFSYRSTEAFKKENKSIVEKMKERQMKARAYEKEAMKKLQDNNANS